jgi:hypothetical protein
MLSLWAYNYDWGNTAVDPVVRGSFIQGELQRNKKLQWEEEYLEQKAQYEESQKQAALALEKLNLEIEQKNIALEQIEANRKLDLSNILLQQNLLSILQELNELNEIKRKQKAMIERIFRIDEDDALVLLYGFLV